MSKVLFKFGTRAQYNALPTKLSDALYFLTDTNELYKGTIPLGQNHIYTGNRQVGDTLAGAIASILNGKIPTQGDIIVVNNNNNGRDAFVYSIEANDWVHIGSTLTDSISANVAELEGKVANLEVLINGVDPNPQEGIEGQTGLIDRVDDLETRISSLTGAWHFKGTVVDLDTVENPAEGDVYQVGQKEYAWNGEAWVELGDLVDLSAYPTRTEFNNEITQIRNQLGSPQRTYTTDSGTEITVPRSGLYKELFETPSNLIPVFDGTKVGLVPVADATVTDVAKAQKFLNALGEWVTVTVNPDGNAVYTAPDGRQFNNVEDYVEYMIETSTALMWEAIDV